MSDSAAFGSEFLAEVPTSRFGCACDESAQWPWWDLDGVLRKSGDVMTYPGVDPVWDAANR